MDLINQLGGKQDFVILCLLYSILICLNTTIKRKEIRLLTAFVSALFITLQIISLYFTQSFIGYQFYVHTNLRDISSLRGLFNNGLLLSLGYTCIFTFIIYISYKLNDVPLFKKTRLIYIFVAVIVIYLNGNFNSDTKTLAPIFKSTNDKQFTEILQENGLVNYIRPNEIKASKGKNIIIISLEAIEKGFLDDKFKAITPNLRQLKNKWNYVDLNQNLGSEWTSGSLYTSLTGFPAFFGIEGNNIFQTAYHSNISAISHAFKKSNYNLTYLNGNTDFSGVKEMLNIFKFDNVIDYRNSPKSGHESYYGIRDKELFSIAKKEIHSLQKNNEQFAFFISTTDTHFPNGIYDNRMESYVSKQNSTLEFTIASLDYLIGDFINFLEQEKILDNTTVVIFPDHLKMGDPSLLNDTGTRQLYYISSNEIEQNGPELYQIDIPKLILKSAGVRHNIKFLTDYIENNKTNKFINDNINQIAQINTSGINNSEIELFSKPVITNKYNDYIKDTMRYIANAGGGIDGNTYTNSLEALELNYKKGFRIFELDILETADYHFVAAHDWEECAELTNYQGELPASREVFMSKKLHNKYTPLDMDAINNWFKKKQDAILITDKINNPITFSSQFIDKKRLMMELFDNNSLQQGLNCNILSAVPSQSIVNKLDIDDIKALAQKGVKHIAISRSFIKHNKPFLNELKQNNIKAYAFHVNFTSGFDETYVTKYEMDNIYGIYADEWTFNNTSTSSAATTSR